MTNVVEHRLVRLKASWSAGGMATVLSIVWVSASGTYSLAAPPGDDKPAAPPADLVIVNAKIWTGAEPIGKRADRADEPTALAIVAHTIAAVGNDKAIRSRVGPDTKVIDAKGRRVIPGLTDSHTHLVSGGFQLARLQLRNVRSREEFVKAVAVKAKETEKGEWLLGGRWSVESWDKPEAPNKSWLDPVTGDTPVLLTRMDGHQALVNSAALKLAGIDASGPKDPKGGEVEREPKSQEPTGILKESAMGLVSRLIPDPTPLQRYEALRRALRHATSLGITSAHDMCSPDDVNAFRRALLERKLTVRVTAYVSVADWAAYAERIPSPGLDNDRIRLAGLKGFMDGSLGSRTAFMRQPYADATPEMPYPRGQLSTMADPPESFEKLVVSADARGLQLAVHAIGDEGNHLLLDAYEAAMTNNGRRDARHRDEHAQHLLVSDIPRFGKLGVVASMQPFHKADDGRYAEKALSSARLRGSYAFRQLVDAGALVIFGSDWPVVTMNPFAGIAAAVNARTLAGEVWLPSHSLTVEEALYAYTVAPQKAVHREDRLGTIEPGKLADIVTLSKDPFTIPAERLAEVKVAQTIVGGKVFFSWPQ